MIAWTLKTKVLAVALGVGLLGGGLWAWTSAAERHARDLAIAGEHERQAEELKQANSARDRERTIEREATAKLIEANQQLADRLAATVSTRNASTDRIIGEIRAHKTTDEVVKESKDNLGITPTVAGNTFVLTQEQFQELIAIKVDRDRLALNVTDLDSRLRLVEDTNKRLATDNAALVASAKEKDEIIAVQGKSLAEYKKVAKRSKWRKFGSVVGKVGLAVIPAIAVGVIMK